MILLVAMATCRAVLHEAAKALRGRETARPDAARPGEGKLQHRLRNRLSLTVGYCELVADDPRLPADLREMLLEARAGARAAAELAEQADSAVREVTEEVGRLSPREQEVAALVAEGLTSSGIAARLGMAHGTVSNHLTHILRKLGLARRSQLAAWAVRHGLRPPDDHPGGTQSARERPPK